MEILDIAGPAPCDFRDGRIAPKDEGKFGIAIRPRVVELRVVFENAQSLMDVSALLAFFPGGGGGGRGRDDWY